MKLFEKADKDHNGTLDLKELQAVISRAFKKNDLSFLSKESLRDYTKLQMSTFDEDNSGTLKFEEFVELYNTILEDPSLHPDIAQSAHKADEEFDEGEH